MHKTSRLKMVGCLLSVMLLTCAVHAHTHTQAVGAGHQKPGGGAKMLLLARLARTENDVVAMEPKGKRSFPGDHALPLDRLSVSVMETKLSNKQRKVLESPRRRVPPPIDRIGVSRLPTGRG